MQLQTFLDGRERPRVHRAVVAAWHNRDAPRRGARPALVGHRPGQGEARIHCALINGEGDGRAWSTPKTRSGWRRFRSTRTRSHPPGAPEPREARAGQGLLGRGPRHRPGRRELGQPAPHHRAVRASPAAGRSASHPAARSPTHLRDLGARGRDQSPCRAGALGHSHGSVTIGIYGHVDQRQQANAAALLAAKREGGIVDGPQGLTLRSVKPRPFGQPTPRLPAASSSAGSCVQPTRSLLRDQRRAQLRR